MKQGLICMLIVTTIAVTVQSLTSSTDCDFDGDRPFCRWKREWFGMRRSGWRRGINIRNAHLTTLHGKFALFRARSRPEGFRSQLRSSSLVVRENSCFVFRYALGGAKQPYPDGMMLLRVYLVGNGESPDRRIPFFESDVRTPRGNFRKVALPLAEAFNDVKKIASLQFVIEAVRGGSKKAYVAVDDVSLRPCETPEENLEEVDNKRSDMMSQLLGLVLPAYKEPPLVMIVPTANQSGSVVPSTGRELLVSHRLTGTPTSALEFTSRAKNNRKRRKKKNRKRKEKSRRRRRKDRRRKHKTTATSFGTTAISTRPPFLRVVMCDFIEYTQRLQRCLRTFFSSLQSHRNSCRSNYAQLEICLLDAAQSCIPSRDLTRLRISEILNSTLRNNFRTKQVYCEEEGAFVFPEFSVAKQRLQCGPRYFEKLTKCGGSFSYYFQRKHGDPKLCKEYYAANECQRQSTAEECNFDAETMMRYGLSLQYQFVHNPFCIQLPFSSWWPVS